MLEPVTFKMPEDMLRMAALIAREQDITVGQLLRELLRSEISRLQNARPPNRADEQLIAPLRARLAAPFAAATSWADLQARLAAQDFELRAAGGGLALHRKSSTDRLCKASELGFSYSRLIERFRAGFPGHAHTWVAQRVLSRSPGESDGEALIDTEDDFAMDQRIPPNRHLSG